MQQFERLIYSTIQACQSYPGIALLIPAVLVLIFYITGSEIWSKQKSNHFKHNQPKIEPLIKFDWRTEKPRQLRPFRPIYNITMAIKSEPISDLITIDNQYLSRVMTRRDIITNYQKTVHGCLPGGETAVYELYTFLLTHYLPTRFPTIFTISKNSFHNKVTGKTFPTTPPQDPEICLRILGETVEEDIFLLKETETTHVCLAFTCCFPTGFDPSSKLGLGLTGIHGPVPSYEKIGPSMERFFRKLEAGKSVKRMNWNVQTGEYLINVAGNHINDGDEFVADEDVDHSKANLRIELQSLTRLPETKFVLFCFKTYLYSLADVKAEGTGSELADAIEGLQKGNAPGMFKYKSTVRWGKSVAEYLRS